MGDRVDQLSDGDIGMVQTAIRELAEAFSRTHPGEEQPFGIEFNHRAEDGPKRVLVSASEVIEALAALREGRREPFDALQGRFGNLDFLVDVVFPFAATHEPSLGPVTALMSRIAPGSDPLRPAVQRFAPTAVAVLAGQSPATGTTAPRRRSNPLVEDLAKALKEISAQIVDGNPPYRNRSLDRLQPDQRVALRNSVEWMRDELRHLEGAEIDGGKLLAIEFMHLHISSLARMVTLDAGWAGLEEKITGLTGLGGGDVVSRAFRDLSRLERSWSAETASKARKLKFALGRFAGRLSVLRDSLSSTGNPGLDGQIRDDYVLLTRYSVEWEETFANWSPPWWSPAGRELKTLLERISKKMDGVLKVLKDFMHEDHLDYGGNPKKFFGVLFELNAFIGSGPNLLDMFTAIQTNIRHRQGSGGLTGDIASTHRRPEKHHPGGPGMAGELGDFGSSDASTIRAFGLPVSEAFPSVTRRLERGYPRARLPGGAFSNGPVSGGGGSVPRTIDAGVNVRSTQRPDPDREESSRVDEREEGAETYWRGLYMDFISALIELSGGKPCQVVCDLRTLLVNNPRTGHAYFIHVPEKDYRGTLLINWARALKPAEVELLMADPTRADLGDLTPPGYRERGPTPRGDTVQKPGLRERLIIRAFEADLREVAEILVSLDGSQIERLRKGLRHWRAVLRRRGHGEIAKALPAEVSRTDQLLLMVAAISANEGDFDRIVAKLLPSGAPGLSSGTMPSFGVPALPAGTPANVPIGH